MKTLALSRDSKFIVSGSVDKTVRIWEFNGKENKRENYFGHNGTIRAVAITKEFNYVVSGSDDRTVRVWNLRENTQEAVLWDIMTLLQVWQ